MPALTKTFQFSPYQTNSLAAEANVNFDDMALYINTWDGWQADSTTWTRTGNFTFTVPTDLTARYRKGTKIRYKDGGDFEYGYVKSSAYVAPTTTVTLVTNSDYTMAAATITNNEYSYASCPQGFPARFNFDCAPTGFAATPTQNISKFTIEGGVAFIYINVSGTSNATTSTITVPIAIEGASSILMPWGFGRDNGAPLAAAGTVEMLGGGTTVNIYKDMTAGAVAWTNANAKHHAFNIFYDI